MPSKKTSTKKTPTRKKATTKAQSRQPKKAKAPQATATKALSEATDQLLKLRVQRQRAEQKVADLKKQETELGEALLGMMQTSKLTSVAGLKARATVTPHVVPKIVDFDAFLKHFKRKGNDDLLQRRISQAAWRERVDNGVQVPGIEGVQLKKLHLSVLKK